MSSSFFAASLVFVHLKMAVNKPKVNTIVWVNTGVQYTAAPPGGSRHLHCWRRTGFCTTQVWSTSYIWVSERKSDFNPSIWCSISSVTDHAVGGIPKKRFKNAHAQKKNTKTVISLLAVTSTVNALGSFERNTDDTGTKWLCWGSPIYREQGQTKSCGF